MLKSKINRLRGPALHDSTLELGLDAAPHAPAGASEASRAAQPVQWDKLKGSIKSRLILIAPILLSVLLSIVGQLILKSGMSQLGPISLTDRSIVETVWSIATNLAVVVGMVIFAASFLLWLVGLSRVPLSYAYPFISLSYVVILAASYFLLGESVSLVRVLGVIVISAGVLLVAAS
jgi:drug/metabolite transporter (DMT)-like permease